MGNYASTASPAVLRKSTGASLVGTSTGDSVQEELEVIDQTRNKVITNFAALESSAIAVGEIVEIRGHTPIYPLVTPFTGGGRFVGVPTPTVPYVNDGGTKSPTADPLIGAQRLDIEKSVNIFHFGAVRGGDIFAALQAAVDASPSTHNIGTAYIYEPSWIIDIPWGNFTLTDRVVITKNNITVRGAGMFSTNITCPNTILIEEMIRFKGAYACGLLNLTLDGGLPFTVVGTEAYGAEIPLVTDQCAHFQMDQVNICNYRVRGWQAIHLWESNIGEIRIFNGGYFAVAAGVNPFCIGFTSFRKEEMTFSGSESNQIYIAKLAVSCPGGIVDFDSPCFNIKIGHVVAEGRTYSWLPLGMGTPKFRFSGLSSLCVVDQAWCYFHEQTAACTAALIDGVNAGPGCVLDNIFVYQELTNAAKFLEVTDIFRTTSASSIVANVSIQDVGGVGGLTNLFVTGGASSGSIITGNIQYRNVASRTISNFMGALGTTNFMGKVTFSVGAFGAAQPVVYNFKANEKDVSTIDGGGIFDEFKCRAIANFNGAAAGGGARMEKGMSCARSSTGTYAFTFTQAMPDANYAICPAIVKVSSVTDAVEIAGQSTLGFTLVVRDAAGTLHDTTTLTVSVFR